MGVGPGEAHEMQIFFLDPVLELLRLPALVIAPQAVPFNEAHAAFHRLIRAALRKSGI
jgi:hypothetical protein